jgi:elongation factor 1 alpha-like protein
MGRLLYELGVLSEKEKIANERGSEKMGKSSFQYAWALDGTAEERERCFLLLITLISSSLLTLWFVPQRCHYGHRT